MCASPDRAAYMKSKHRVTNCRRERTITVDLAACVIRVLRHLFIFTVKHWNKNEAYPCAIAPPRYLRF
jgi:hypothetical protein